MKWIKLIVFFILGLLPGVKTNKIFYKIFFLVIAPNLVKLTWDNILIVDQYLKKVKG